jgi:hypothetical protein
MGVTIAQSVQRRTTGWRLGFEYRQCKVLSSLQRPDRPSGPPALHLMSMENSFSESKAARGGPPCNAQNKTGEAIPALPHKCLHGTVCNCWRKKQLRLVSTPWSRVSVEELAVTLRLCEFLAIRNPKMHCVLGNN